jgi:acetone carboxylase gamma subunit
MTSHGVHLYATGELFTSTQASCSTLPQSKDVLSLYNAWERFSQWLKVEDEQADLNSQIVRPSSWDDTPRVPQTEDSEISSVLYRLRCEVEDALVFEGQNRAKQAANQRQTHLSLRPSDAIKRQVQETCVLSQVGFMHTLIMYDNL